MKIAVKISIIIASFGILGIIGGMLLVYFYESDIKQYAINELNKNLKTELKIHSIEMNVFRQFPFISLQFNDILALDSFDKTAKDSLFYFGRGWLKFNIFDVLQENYRIKRINLEDGFANIKINKSGLNNFDIIKSSGKTNDFFLQLNQLSLRNTKVFYDNELNRDRFDFLIDEVTAKGAFSSKVYQLQIKGEFMANLININSVNYLVTRSIELKAGFAVNRKTHSYMIDDGEVTIDHSMQFKLSGSFADEGDNVSVNMKISSNNLSLSRALELLPDKLTKGFEKYRSGGIVNFTSNISGNAGKTSTPLITATFEMSNGYFEQINNGNKLELLSMKGTYSNGRTKKRASPSLTIKKMEGHFANGNFDGSLYINYLPVPEVNGSLTGDFSISDLINFTGYDTIINATGNFKINAKYNGRFNNLSDLRLEEFIKGQISGKIKFDSLYLRLKAGNNTWKNCAGILELHNKDIIIKKLNGKISNSDFDLKGICRNAIPFITGENELLTIEATFQSNHIDLDSLLMNSDSNDNIEYTIKLPQNIHINFNIDIGHLNFRRFRCEMVHGIVRLDNNGLTAKPISFKSMQGTTEGVCYLLPLKDNQYQLSTVANTQDIDVKELFYQFENFGQKTITEHHLKGKTTASIQCSFPIRDDLSINPDEVKVSADIEIRKGELIQFEPMKEIANYFRNNKLLATIVKADELDKKLQHISFSKLANHIEIQNKLITIPDMKIQSSALDLEISGTHSFENNVDYYLNFYFTDLLTMNKKPKKEDIGYIQDDGLGRTRIFLKMEGKFYDPDIQFDKKGMLLNLKNKKQQESKIIKGILNEEFGLFKNDTNVIKPDQSEPETEFLIEWEELENEAKASDKTDSSGKKKATIKKMFQKLEQQKEHNEEFDFEDDDY